jgi:hypothetical protein
MFEELSRNNSLKVEKSDGFASGFTTFPGANFGKGLSEWLITVIIGV